MITAHTFRPYCDIPELCVAELEDGSTCNHEEFEHASELPDGEFPCRCGTIINAATWRHRRPSGRWCEL